MPKQQDIFRETWSADGRYLIRAYARIADATYVGYVSRALGVVQVFDGDPAVNGKAEVFLSSSRLNSYDLLDELQNAESIGRDFIAAMRR